MQLFLLRSLGFGFCVWATEDVGLVFEEDFGAVGEDFGAVEEPCTGTASFEACAERFSSCLAFCCDSVTAP